MRNLNEEILKKYLAGECSEREISEVRDYIKESDEHARQIFRMEEIYQLGKRNAEDEARRMEIAERRLCKRLKEEDARQLHRRQRALRWTRCAAVIAVLLLIGGGAAYWFPRSSTDMLMVTAGKGTVEEVTLPDGTKVWLNDAATLKYPRRFAEGERSVYLDGEAYFEVAKNRHRPFIVESEVMSVRVLGTVFNFKYDKRYRVAEATLIEGEIEVRGKRNEGQITLAPGQRAELNKNTGKLTVRQVEAKLDAVWHDDLIPFEKADIFTIAKVLERFYDVKIILSPDIRADKTYSGVLKKKATIESVLNSLQNSIPIRYKIEDGNIFISSDDKN